MSQSKRNANILDCINVILIQLKKLRPFNEDNDLNIIVKTYNEFTIAYTTYSNEVSKLLRNSSVVNLQIHLFNFVEICKERNYYNITSDDTEALTLFEPLITTTAKYVIGICESEKCEDYKTVLNFVSNYVLYLGFVNYFSVVCKKVYDDACEREIQVSKFSIVNVCVEMLRHLKTAYIIRESSLITLLRELGLSSIYKTIHLYINMLKCSSYIMSTCMMYVDNGNVVKEQFAIVGDMQILCSNAFRDIIFDIKKYLISLIEVEISRTKGPESTIIIDKLCSDINSIGDCISINMSVINSFNQCSMLSNSYLSIICVYYNLVQLIVYVSKHGKNKTLYHGNITNMLNLMNETHMNMEPELYISAVDKCIPTYIKQNIKPTSYNFKTIPEIMISMKYWLKCRLNIIATDKYESIPLEDIHKFLELEIPVDDIEEPILDDDELVKIFAEGNMQVKSAKSEKSKKRNKKPQPQTNPILVRPIDVPDIKPIEQIVTKPQTVETFEDFIPVVSKSAKINKSHNKNHQSQTKQPVSQPPIVKPVSQPPIVKPFSQPPIVKPVSQPPIVKPVSQQPIVKPTISYSNVVKVPVIPITETQIQGDTQTVVQSTTTEKPDIATYKSNVLFKEIPQIDTKYVNQHINTEYMIMNTNRDNLIKISKPFIECIESTSKNSEFDERLFTDFANIIYHSISEHTALPIQTRIFNTTVRFISHVLVQITHFDFHTRSIHLYVEALKQIHFNDDIYSKHTKVQINKIYTDYKTRFESNAITASLDKIIPIINML
jgi:hypothetical protein